MSVLKMLSESSGAGLRRAAGGVNLRARTQGLAGRYFQEQNVLEEKAQFRTLRNGVARVSDAPAVSDDMGGNAEVMFLKRLVRHGADGENHGIRVNREDGASVGDFHLMPGEAEHGR